MRILRIAGLLVILAAAAGGVVEEVRASAPVTCWKYCDDVFFSGQCWLSLEECCENMSQRCPAPLQFVSGDCTDGTNFCP